MDLKKFSAENADHVIPIIDVIRPPTGYKDSDDEQKVDSAMNSESKKGSRVKEEKVLSKKIASKKRTKEETQRLIQKMNFSWKRIRPENYEIEDEEVDKIVTSPSTQPRSST